MNASLVVVASSFFLLTLVPAQQQYASLASPHATQSICYLPARDRLVGLDTYFGNTWEFDGTNFTSFASTPAPATVYLIGACDEGRSEAIAISKFFATTWAWDGVGWSQRGAVPVRLFPYDPNRTWNYLMAYHRGLQTVLMLVPNYTMIESELWSWDGQNWSQVAAPGGPPTRVGSTRTYYYASMTHDQRLDRLTVFGRVVSSSPPLLEGNTWHWSPTSGWVEEPGLVPVAEFTTTWFDEHRGRLMRFDQSFTPLTHVVREMDTNGQWQVVPVTGTPELGRGAYDRNRSRFYSTHLHPGVLGWLEDQWPAPYDFVAPGCVVAMPELGLTHPWTRAWLGDTLSVTATGLPLSVGLLVMGFSDQQFGGTSLPYSLAPHGIPNCVLGVAPDATLLAVGAGGAATFTLPIPNVPTLLGVPFWQQVFAPWPGINPAGMRPSAWHRGVVGRR